VGNTSNRFHFQDYVCGKTGGQFAFVLIIREINKGKHLDNIFKFSYRLIYLVFRHL
jgi:hypothetical protein